MKTLYLSLIALFFAINCSYAQFTTSSGNTTTSDNVGIGTATPFSAFHVLGRAVIGAQGESPTGFFLAPPIGNNQLYLSSSTAPALNIGTSLSLGGRYNSTNQFQIAYGSLVGAKENTVDADVAGYLAFYTANSTANADVEQMRITSNGKVGIGTTSLPTNGKLQVNGPVDIISVNNSGVFRVFDGSNFAGGVGSDAWANGGSSTDFGVLSPNNLYLSAGWQQRLNILSSGNVGVATTDPKSLFQVDDGCSKLNVGDASGGDLNYGTSYLGFNAARNGTSWSTSNDDHNNNGGGVIYSNIFGDMYFSVIPTTGTSSDLSLTDANIKSNIALRIDHTNGAVYAKQIYVQTPLFPDYVFKSDYKLMPLASLKSYINENHHLPEMPTAAEVEKEGLNVGEINKLLTKKVEELTLYLIESDREKKEQQHVNQAQNNRIEKLENQVETLLKTLPQQIKK